MVWAMRAASRTADGVVPVSSSGDQGSERAGCSCFSVGQISTSPASPARCATCAIGSGEVPTPGVRSGAAKMRSTAASSGSAARNDRLSGTRRHGSRACPARAANASPVSANMVGAAPWKP